MSIVAPSEFVWGVSTAGYAIEGGVREDGRGPGIWDPFSQRAGAIADGADAEIAADHYHRWAEDVALLRELGVGAYRFSVSWPRIHPAGGGRPNTAGLDFYDRLVDALLDAGIQPWVCLHHWDLPQALQDKGGWRLRDLAFWFTDYGLTVADRLGDRVPQWLIMNQNAASAWYGQATGTHAPGNRDRDAYFSAMHHMNLAQGMAARALRAESSTWRLGTVLGLRPGLPADENPRWEEATALYDALWHGCWFGPLADGRYPDSVADDLKPWIDAGDGDIMRADLDFLGLAYEGPAEVREDRDEPLMLAVTSGMGRGAAAPDRDAEILGEALADLARRHPQRAFYLLADGVAMEDPAARDGMVADTRRIDVLDAHVEALLAARAKGADIRGYFVYSLLDGFEWSLGRSRSCGLVHVDRRTRARTPKASFRWYQSLIREGRAAVR